MTKPLTRARSRAFEHTAHLYDGHDDFVDAVGSCVGDWVERGDAVLVVTESPRLDAIRDLHGTVGDAVTYLDSREAGRNPTAFLPTWKAFVERARADGRSASAVGEPLWDGRTADEATEVMLNERLVNGQRDVSGLSILCTYDVNVLSPALRAEVARNHPTLYRDGERTPSERWAPPTPDADPLALPLPPAPSDATVVSFGAYDYARVRDVAASMCAAAGLSASRTEDVVLVAHELATNCVQHGGGRGVLRAWRDEPALVVEASAGGRFDDPLTGRRPPSELGERGRGLWLVNRLCDLVQLRNTPDGTVVRAHTRLP